MGRPAPDIEHPLPGGHVCAFYRGPAERDRLMETYVRDGMRAGSACLCIKGDDGEVDITSTLDGEESRPGHGRTDTTEPDPMLQLISDWYRAASERDDCDSARVVADMAWVIPGPASPSIAIIASYEACATTWARPFPQSCICMYDLDKFGGVALAVIKAHPRVWVRGVELENPYASDIAERAAMS